MRALARFFAFGAFGFHKLTNGPSSSGQLDFPEQVSPGEKWDPLKRGAPIPEKPA